jgi:hypothetical protein
MFGRAFAREERDTYFDNIRYDWVMKNADQEVKEGLTLQMVEQAVEHVGLRPDERPHLSTQRGQVTSGTMRKD